MSVLKRWNGTTWEPIGPAVQPTAESEFYLDEEDILHIGNTNNNNSSNDS